MADLLRMSEVFDATSGGKPGSTTEEMVWVECPGGGERVTLDKAVVALRGEDTVYACRWHSATLLIVKPPDAEGKYSYHPQGGMGIEVKGA